MRSLTEYNDPINNAAGQTTEHKFLPETTKCNTQNTDTVSEQSSAQHEPKQVQKWLYIVFTLLPTGIIYY